MLRRLFSVTSLLDPQLPRDQLVELEIFEGQKAGAWKVVDDLVAPTDLRTMAK
jgi:hypothetical protein